MKTTGVALLAAGVLGMLSGCGTSDDSEPSAVVTVTKTATVSTAAPPTPSEQPSANPEEVGWENAITLVSSVVEKNDYRTARKVAAPGSGAERYVMAQQAQYDTQVTVEGSAPEASETIVNPKAHTVTMPDSENGDLLFSDFKYDAKGLVPACQGELSPVVHSKSA